jgi:FixJ family two-component response regulator
MTGNATIFLCDDDQEVLNGLSFLLRESGYKVRSYESGKELLEAIELETKPLRAVFVLDLHNPPMDGDLIHDELIERGYTTRSPVIFLSGTGTISRAVSAVAKGALNFVEKPHADNALLSLVAEAIAKEEKQNANANRCEFLAFMWESLTEKQRKCALLVAAGDPNKVVAGKLGIVESTVEKHKEKISEKLGVDSTASLATTIADMKSCGVILTSSPTLAEGHRLRAKEGDSY